MQLVRFISTGLFWLGYPFLFFFQSLIRFGKFFLEHVFIQSLKHVWKGVVGMRALLRAKVPASPSPQTPQSRPFWQKWHVTVPKEKELRFPFIQLLTFFSKRRTSQTAHQIMPAREMSGSPAEEDTSPSSASEVSAPAQEQSFDFFAYQWTDVLIIHSRWRNFLFELQWWWKHGTWRQLLPRPKTPEVVTVFATLHVPWWIRGSIFVVGVLALVGVATYQVIFVDLPSPASIRTRTPKMTTKIYDRDGNVLYKIFKDENRTYVHLDEISPHLVQATLAIEDDQFYEHWGISFRGIGRAFWHNMQNESVQGGSTITQQLVKNTLLSSERTWRRKLREAVLAIAVDAQYTKQEILELYLNEVNYGGSIYGVEEASRWYFDKSASELSLAESALLAGLPVAPTTHNPFGSHPERAFQRQQEVLHRMADIGLITSEQLEQAKDESIAFRTGQHDIASPHFVMHVRELLVAAYGEEMVSQGGLEVYTSLDPDLQASAEAAVAQELVDLERLQVSNGAALVTNPNSGEVLAMVGSKNYFDSAYDGQVNVVFRTRQPGSSIKPVAYALAFEDGYTPQSTIDDVAVVYTSPGSPPYAPRNYDGQFYGEITLREALANSRNIPAVRLLANLGVSRFAQFGQELGISTWGDSSRHGLAMALGSNEVTMYDMAKVYGVFANGGQRVELNPIVRVYDHAGNQLYRNPCAGATTPCNGDQVISSATAYQLTSVLSDNQARSRAFGLNSVLHLPGQEVAVKTGTTNSMRDNWTIGYTNDTVVLTWVGNNDNTPMSAVTSGITGASPIWNEIMTSALGDQSHQFALPVGLERVKICASTGTLPCSACPDIVEAVYPVMQKPQTACESSWFSEGKLIDEKRTAQL